MAIVPLISSAAAKVDAPKLMSVLRELFAATPLAIVVEAVRGNSQPRSGAMPGNAQRAPGR
jgi:hypothetical protein